MKVVLFNLHDMVLVWVLATCFLVAIVVANSNHYVAKFQRQSKTLAVIFFLLSGVSAVDTLLFWGEGVRYIAFDLFPPLLTVFSFAGFAVGPVFYYFVLSELESEKRLKKTFYFHFLPAVSAPIYLYWCCYQYPVDVQRELILNLTIYSVAEAHFPVFIALKKTIPFLYGIMALKRLIDELNPTARSYKHFIGLIYLSAGYSLVGFWVLITHILGIWIPVKIGDVMGLFGNYLTLSFLFFLIVTLFRTAESGGRHFSSKASTANNESEIDEMALLIQNIMDNDRPYLNSRLTLDRFSKLVSLSPRQVSLVINKHFHQNFQEYINRHRVEESKVLLRDFDKKHLSILEVSELSGFNSKATFNRLFKSLMSMSPSEYRHEFL